MPQHASHASGVKPCLSGGYWAAPNVLCVCACVPVSGKMHMFSNSCSRLGQARTKTCLPSFAERGGERKTGEPDLQGSPVQSLSSWPKMQQTILLCWLTLINTWEINKQLTNPTGAEACFTQHPDRHCEPSTQAWRVQSLSLLHSSCPRQQRIRGAIGSRNHGPANAEIDDDHLPCRTIVPKALCH